jgi:hypothetical protein
MQNVFENRYVETRTFTVSSAIADLVRQAVRDRVRLTHTERRRWLIWRAFVAQGPADALDALAAEVADIEADVADMLRW